MQGKYVNAIQSQHLQKVLPFHDNRNNHSDNSRNNNNDNLDINNNSNNSS